MRAIGGLALGGIVGPPAVRSRTAVIATMLIATLIALLRLRPFRWLRADRCLRLAYGRRPVASDFRLLTSNFAIRPDRQLLDDAVSGRQRAAATREPTRYRLHRPRRCLLRQLFQHVDILLLDHRPGVVLLEERAPVATECRLQARTGVDRPHGLGELVKAAVEQAGVTADALALQHVALGVGEHRLAHGPRLERHHRQALEIRGHDQQLGGGHRVVLVLVFEEAQVMNARMRRNCHVRCTDQHQVHAIDQRRAVVFEELEQLEAALVLVDAANVDRESVAHLELLAEAAAVRPFGNLGANADHDARHRLVVRDALDQRLFLERVVHQRANAAEHRRENGQAQRPVALGGRHQNGLRRHRAAAVERVVIAEAEEDEEVVVGFVRLDVVDERRAGGPFGIEPRQFIAQRVRLREDLGRPLRELDRVALDRHREAVDRNPVDDLQAGWQLVLPRDVIAMRAGREHLDLDVLGQMLRDVTGMLLGTAVDVSTVPLDDDRDLHCSPLSSEDAGATGPSGTAGAGDASVASAVDCGSRSSKPSPSSPSSGPSSPASKVSPSCGPAG